MISLSTRIRTDHETTESVQLTFGVQRRDDLMVLRVDAVEGSSRADLLGVTMALDVATDCHVVRIGLPRATEAGARSMLQGVAGFASFLRRDGTSWTGTLSDVMGTYTAQFRRRGPREIERRKLRYDRVIGGPAVSVAALTGTTLFELDREGGLSRVSAHEGSRVVFPGGTVDGEVVVDWRFMPGESAPPVDLPDGIEWQVPGEPPPVRPASELASRIARLPAGRSAAAVLRALPLAHDQMLQLGDELAAALRDDPSALSTVAVALRDPHALVEPEQRAAVFYALGMVETAEAQAFLAGLATAERASEFDRLHSIVALHSVVALSPDAVRAVVGILAGPTQCEPCIRAATMAVATWAGRTNAPVEASTAFDERLPEIMARDPILGLAAVENHGGPVVEHWGRAMLGGDASNVRVAAAHALGTLPAIERWSILAPLLAEERNPEVLVLVEKVLAAAVVEGVVPTASEVEASTRLLAAEAPDVRGAAIELVGAEAARSTVARAALVGRFRQESDATLRRAIGRYVTASELGSTR